MYRSLKISVSDNHISIKKNKIEKTTTLVLSILAETFFYYILFKNISEVKEPSKAKYAIILLSAITLIYLILLFLSLRNFFIDKDFNIEIDGEQVLVNEVKTFRKESVEISVEDHVNRWGTKTYNISLKNESHSIKIASGVDKIDKENLFENLKSIFQCSL